MILISHRFSRVLSLTRTFTITLMLKNTCQQFRNANVFRFTLKRLLVKERLIARSLYLSFFPLSLIIFLRTSPFESIIIPFWFVSALFFLKRKKTDVCFHFIVLAKSFVYKCCSFAAIRLPFLLDTFLRLRIKIWTQIPNDINWLLARHFH